MNIGLRFKNKTTLIALVGAVVAFIYQILAIFSIVPAIAENTVMEFAGLLINILAALGIVVDPTTAGITDSQQAMTYEKPKK